MHCVHIDERVLLREGDTMRWVRVVSASQPRSDGTQVATVISLDQYGRSKPKRVTIGATAFVEQWQ